MNKSLSALLVKDFLFWRSTNK